MKFKTNLLKSSLCTSSDTYILFKGTMSVPNMVAPPAVANNGNKKLIFKNCAPFTDYMSKINK